MVGVARLELAASWSRTKHATNCATPRFFRAFLKTPAHYNEKKRTCQALSAKKREKSEKSIPAGFDLSCGDVEL